MELGGDMRVWDWTWTPTGSNPSTFKMPLGSIAEEICKVCSLFRPEGILPGPAVSYLKGSVALPTS